LFPGQEQLFRPGRRLGRIHYGFNACYAEEEVQVGYVKDLLDLFYFWNEDQLENQPQYPREQENSKQAAAENRRELRNYQTAEDGSRESPEPYDEIEVGDAAHALFFRDRVEKEVRDRQVEPAPGETAESLGETEIHPGR